MGFGQPAFIGLHVEASRLDEVADAVAALEEVTYVVVTAGRFDMICEVVCEDNEHLLRVLADQLAKIDGIQGPPRRWWSCDSSRKATGGARGRRTGVTVAERRELDRERVRAVGQREEAAYRARTPRSAELHVRARRAMPLGVASSFQTYDPYPLFMTDARGSRIWDADGNEYIDFDMAFGVLAAGHSHPLVAEALQRRVANGTCYTFPVEDGVALAEEIKQRFGIDLVRFSNSGTEATMDAIRVARGFTGREKVAQVRGRLPRPPRRRAGQHPAAARSRWARPTHPPRVPATAGSAAQPAGRDDRGALQPGGHAWPPSWRRTAARSRPSSSSRCSSTSAWRRRCRASWSGSASSPPSTASCSSSTRSRPAWCSPTAAPPSTSASSPTSSAWPRASAAACRSAPSAAGRRSCARSSRCRSGTRRASASSTPP